MYSSIKSKNLKVLNAKEIIDFSSKLLSSYKDVAELVGVSKGTLSKWKNPNLSYLPKFKALIPIFQLFEKHDIPVNIQLEEMRYVSNEKICEIDMEEVIKELRNEIALDSPVLATIFFGE